MKPNPVTFDPKKPLDGSVSFDLNGVDSAVVSYTPTGKTTPVTATITKGADGKYVSNDPNVIVDPTTGKVTIPEDKVADNTTVTVVVTKDGLASDPATTEAGKDALTFTNETNPVDGDGSVKFDLDGADGAKVTYTPSDSDTPVTAEITKDADGKYVSNDPNVKVDPNTGVVTIPEDYIKDNTPVDVVIINNGQESEPQTTTAGEDQISGTIDGIKDTPAHEAPKVTSMTDKSNPADDNPETFVVEGKTRSNADVVIKDKEGNIVGKGKADENGNYKINVSESDKHDIVSGEDLTVITKADGYNPSEEKATISPDTPINYTGDKVGPQNPPVITTDPTTGDNTVEFPKDGDTEQLNVDMTPKGEDPITVEVSKDKDGNITVEVKDQDGNVIGGKDQLPEGVEVDNNGNVIIKDGALETGTEIEATGEDKAGNESDKAVAEVTEPANPSATTPDAPVLTANPGGSVTAALPPAAVEGDKAVLEFNKEGTNEPVTVTLVKTPTGWVVDSTEPAGLNDLVEISGDTVTIPETSVADGSIVTAYSQGKDDTPDQKSATSQAKVLPDNVTTLEDDIKITSYNDSNPAKNDITKVLVEGQTEPNAKVQIKDGDVVVAEGVADASGKFRIEFNEPTGSDFQPTEKLTVVATAPNKLPSEAKEGEIPAIAQDGTGFIGDRVAPETPRLVVGNDGSNDVTITPKDPKPGDVITIAVKDNEGKDVELTVTVGEDGTLTPSPDNADKPALTVNPDGTITLDRTQIKDNTPISVTAKDLAGNTSDPAIKNTGFDNVTTDPTIDSIVSKDTSPKADGNPEEFTISGKAPAGSKVTAKDSQGNVIGSTIANEDGTYTITGAYENPNNDIKTGDNITVVAQEIDAQGNPTAAESRPVQKDVSAPEKFSDVIPTQKPEILEPENNGDIPVKLPEDAVKGDQVTIKVGNDDNGNGTLDDNEVDSTVTVEKQPDGKWKPVDGDTTLVKDPIEGNIAIIPDEKAPNGSVIEVESKDQAGNTSSTEKPIDKLEQTATPVIESIQAKDANNPADGNPDYVIITGTAEPNAMVTVKDPDGNVIGTGVADATTGKFTIKATEVPGTDIKVGNALTVTAQHPAKTESEPATTLASGDPLTVPELNPKVDFDDTVPPSTPVIGTPDPVTGDIPVTLPEDAVKGDQAEITVTQPDGTPSSVIVEKQEDGTWKPVDGDTTLVKDPIEGNVAAIPANKAPEGTDIEVVVKDNAGNESDPATSTVGETPTPPVAPTEKTATPTLEEGYPKFVDTDSPANTTPDSVVVKGKTEPNAEVFIKDKDGNIIGQGTADAEGNFEITGVELTGKDLVVGDNITVTAQAPNKLESNPATKSDGAPTTVEEVPAGDKTLHPNDTTPPTAPDVVQEGNDIIVKLPEDAQPGDKVVISKTTDTNGDGNVDEQDTPSTTTVVKGEDGNWRVDGQDGLGISAQINNDEGTVTVPADNGDIVDAKTVDIAGNESTTDQETVTTPPEKTPTPKDIEITAVDKSNPADTIAEEIIVKGKVDDVPEGTEVRVEDDKGNVIGLGKTDAEGNFEIVVPNDPANPLTEGDKLNVIAEDKAGGKTPSDAGTGLNGANTDVPAIDPTAEGHPNDPTGPSAPELATVAGTGAVAVTFPKDANPGDKVEVSYTKEGETAPTTVTFTKQPDGTWTSSNEAELPSVKDNLSNPQVIIPENSIEDGSEVNAKSIDALIPDAEKPATPVTAGTDAKTATPTFEIVSVDTAAQADGEVDQIKVTGEAEAGSLVVVYDKNGQEIGRVQLGADETNFTIVVDETMGAIKTDDEISVVAKAPNKDVSDPAPGTVPAVTEFNDQSEPASPTVTEDSAKGEGDVTISLPAEDPADPFVKGDQLIIKYTDETTGTDKTATLTHDGKGNWVSDDPNVPSIPAGSTSTTIPEDKVQDKSEVSATLKDVAGNESPATETSKATAGFDEVSRTPTASITGSTDTDNNGDPESVTITGALTDDETGEPIAGALISVKDKNGNVIGTTTTDEKGEYTITLTEGEGDVPANGLVSKETLTVSAIEQENGVPSKDVSADAPVEVPAVTKLAENPTIVGISTDEKSDRTPELFKISGTSEEGATVTAYAKLANGDLVEIGSVKVTNGDAFTLTTKPLAEIDGLDSYSLDDAATEIVLKATKDGQQDSAARDLKAVEVPRGTDENRAEIHPNDKDPIAADKAATVTALPEGFGGANITLPSTEGESLLEVSVSYKNEDGADETVVLTWNGTTWSSDKPDVIAAPTAVNADGKWVAHLPAEQVSAKTGNTANTVSVVTKDYAGNSSPAATATLNEPAGDDIPDRTDLPTLVAGSEQNAGDLVATPGADNDKLELKFVDDQGQDQTITIVKDPIAGEWKIKGENPTGATLDETTGTITVPANKVKDGSEAEAIGHKGDKPSTAEFNDANNLPTEVHVTVTTNADDDTPNQADTPTITVYTEQKDGKDQPLKGGATVKGGKDNVEVLIEAKGYVEVVTDKDGVKRTSSLTTEPLSPTVQPDDSVSVESKDILIKAQKDLTTGKWELVAASKEDYDKAQSLTDEEKQGLTDEQQKEVLQAKKDSVWSPVSSDVASVDKDGNITLKPKALQNDTEVKAKGYNAKLIPSEEAKENVGAEPANKDVDADEPSIPETFRDGSMHVTPGADNQRMKVTYTKEGQPQTVEIEKAETGPDSTVEWKVKDNAELPQGVTLDKNTGKLVFPKGTVDVKTEMTAVGTNKDGYDSDLVSQPVLKDPTPFADAPQAVVDGDKVVVTPGADSEKVKITGTTNDLVTIVKGDNGEWKFEGNTNPDGITLDEKTGKVTINNDKIGQGGIVAEATDGYEPTPNTKESNNGKPVKPFVVDNTANSTEAPELTPIESGEKQGAMTVKPKGDHVEVKVTYTDEQGNTSSITAVRDPQTGEWSLAPAVKTEEKNGEMVTTKEPIPPSRAVIDKVTGEITLMANELQDGKTVKAVAKDVKGNTNEATANAANDPVENEKLPEDQQPDVERPVEAETPTLFQNVDVGEVRIIPGKGVDSIKFNVGVKLPNSAEPVEYINYWLTKDDYGEWVAVAAKVTDKDGDGRLDDDNDDFAILEQSPEALALLSYDKDKGYFTLKDSADGARLSSALDSKVNPKDIEYKIFDIHLAREGEETLSKADIDGFTMMTNHKTETNTAIKAPLYHHVLSNGEALTSPIIEVVKDVQGDQTSTKLKITFDPDTYAMSFYAGFNVNGNNEDNGLHIEKNINNESGKGAYFSDEDGNRSYMVTMDPNNNNVVFVRPTDNVKFQYDVDGSDKNVTDIVYNVNKDDSNIKMKDFFGADDWGQNGKTIALPNVDLSKEDQKYTLPNPPKVENPTDAAEKVDTPTALVDDQHKGGVKVKPATPNSGTKYRVDYLGEDSTDAKVIMVKKGDNGQWQFESNGSSGAIDGTKIKLDASSGELTFAPEAVADGGRVTITAYDSKDKPRAAASVIAQDELPVVEIKQDETNTNIGGVVATPKEGVTKFQLNFTDEGRNNTSTEPKDHVLVYEKKGSHWELVSVDGDSNNKKITINGEEKDLSQADNTTIKLDTNSGQVTFDKDAIGDKSTVTITPYSKRGTLAGGAAKSVQSAVDKLMTYLDDTSATKVEDVGGLDYVYIDNGGYYRGLKQLLNGEKNNTKPTPYLNAEHSQNGRNLEFTDGNDVVKLDKSINYTSYPRWKSPYNFDLDFDFKDGNDLLVVGHDVGTAYINGGRYVSKINMGAGNDVFVVGAHNDYFRVVRHKEYGTFDIAHIDDMEKFKEQGWEDAGLYTGWKYGGQIRHTQVDMGDGDDTVLLMALNSGNRDDRGAYGAIINLGEGNNRLVMSQEIDLYKSIAKSEITAGSGIDVVKAGGFVEGTSIRLGGGDDEVIVGKIEDSTVDLGDGNDWMEVIDMRSIGAEIGSNSKVYLGDGNDVFKLGAKLNASDNSIIDGGNGSDFLLFDVSGAIISTTNFKNFEEVGFMQDDSTINIRAIEIDGLGTPLKVTQADGKNGNKVDFGLAGAGDHESGQNQDQGGNKKYADIGQTYWEKSQSSVEENGVTYDVYTYDNNSKIQVWVENGIEVI
ncbi:Ig-like domain-containing protein [Actinobacillus minor]|uniref:Ig-like domain-containing protein n=1 Tax=Actinobacillus minor TaxID=51047 RepID=UPI0002F87B44|nr:Ig-like domain-containing protein [Actinobacillus minor]